MITNPLYYNFCTDQNERVVVQAKMYKNYLPSFGKTFAYNYKDKRSRKALTLLSELIMIINKHILIRPGSL